MSGDTVVLLDLKEPFHQLEAELPQPYLEKFRVSIPDQGFVEGGDVVADVSGCGSASACAPTNAGRTSSTTPSAATTR